jgi:hypothetical protein
MLCILWPLLDIIYNFNIAVLYERDQRTDMMYSFVSDLPEDNDLSLTHVGGYKLIYDYNSVMCRCWYIRTFTSTMHGVNDIKFLCTKSLKRSAYLTHKLRILHHMTTTLTFQMYFIFSCPVNIAVSCYILQKYY